MFKKKKEEEWNLWEDEIIEDENPEVDSKTSKKKTKPRKRKTVPQSDMYIDESTNYLDEDLGHIYTKEEGPQYSKLRILLFASFLGILILFGIGYVNTDFDEFNKGYVVSYDLHYERQYVSKSDDLYNYCMELKDKLKTVMPEMVNNSLTLTNEINKMQDILKAKTDTLSRYTEVPQVMSSYNDNLIAFSLSSQKMLKTILSSYTNQDYLAWAEKAYSDFNNSLQTIEYLRTQINEVIYRNVYGGETNE